MLNRLKVFLRAVWARRWVMLAMAGAYPALEAGVDPALIYPVLGALYVALFPKP